MKKLIPFLIGGLLVFGAAACQDGAQTSQSSPDTTEEITPETSNTGEVQ